jgi:lipopolysaccharide transport system permease protein
LSKKLTTPDTDEGSWDIDVTPRTKWLELHIAELWRYRDLVTLLVRRDFVAKYKQTILGPVWHIVQPVLTTIMSYFIFNVLAGLSADGKNPILYQLAGITIWTYFSNCLTSTATTFTTNAQIFGKVYFPRMVMPISIVISNLMQMAVQFGLLLAAVIYFKWILGANIILSANLLLLPLIVVLIACLGLGMGIIISSLTTKYRDLAVLITFGVQLLMFGSAVNYPLSDLLAKTSDHSIIYLLVKWNPISTLVETFRNAVLGGVINYGMLLYTTLATSFVLLIGTIIFQKVEKTFMDTV